MALSHCIKRRHLAQKIFEFHAGVKKCHFGYFSERAGMAVPCQCSRQESLGGSEKFFLHWVPMNSQQCWKPKLERAYSFRVQSGKITVCIECLQGTIIIYSVLEYFSPWNALLSNPLCSLQPFAAKHTLLLSPLCFSARFTPCP